MMKLSIIHKLRAVFILALAVLVINAVVSYGNTMQLIHVQRWVTDSQEIITQLENILATIKDVETAQRSYLLFANAEDFKTYLEARQKTDSNLQILSKLTQQKQELISELEQKITNRFNTLQAEVAVYQNQGFDVARQLVLSHRTQTYSNDIQQLIHKFIDAQKNVLQQRIQQSQVISHKSITSFSLAAFVDLVLLAVLYDLVWRYITRLQQTELALRQSENRLRAIIDAEPECIKLIARDGTLLEINASGLAIMEVESADALIGKSVYDAIAPEYRKDYLALHEIVCQGDRGTLEFEIVGFRGTRLWMETHAVPLLNESDGTFLHLAVTRDITKRKFAEQKIREQAALLDVTTDAILVRNIHNQILFWNQGAERLYGWKAEEVLGKNVVGLLYHATKPQLHDALFTVVNKGEWRGELQQLNKDGREIIVESRWTLVRDENGQAKSILSVNTEITQKKQLEAQLLRSQRLESIGTLAGGIAHDLNNVLAPVLMSVHLLQLKLPDQQSQRVLQTLEKNVRRGANLLKQVLSFARGMEGKRTIVQVRQLVQEIEQIVKQTFPKSITCQTELAENLWYISGNTTQLHQVLMNLVVNARDAMPDGGSLKIEVENLVIDQHDAQVHLDAQEGSYIAISVIDTGTGMPPEIQERIFEPFFTTKEIGKGTGLGLSTALGIIKNHGGFLNVYSEVNKGTEFKVYLPVSSDNITPALSPEIEPHKGDGELILVVDDEAVIREITKASLETYNYQVLTANNGVEAVAIYAQYQQKISVVLLDMMMPTMDGAIAIRTLQKINPHVKIIAISGLLSSQNIAEVAGMGVKAFLAKPCTAQELLQTIGAINSQN
ncbi:PAS domain S-box protein [Calothrix sp. PCC 7507]|uniref:PAS domain S-box protein n=1 Tax=Calothrix sp. PCC 7507 TaxID=99598 RepID=UPI00029F313F|nr:PAS domain S-box protein [Calothrix sp. PCC 7507]AFY34014.1 multi-sensor hybrid histidine kinase [Calothrix sp. PCC 7507]